MGMGGKGPRRQSSLRNPIVHMAEPFIADKSAKLRTPQLATAALLIKTALYNQYKTQITVGNKYESKTKGTLSTK